MQRAQVTHELAQMGEEDLLIRMAELQLRQAQRLKEESRVREEQRREQERAADERRKKEEESQEVIMNEKRL